MHSVLEAFSCELADLVARALPSTVTISGETADLAGGGSGSGWVFDQAGHVVTNFHVIQELAGPIKVRPAGAPPLTGEVIGHDRETDLAVLRLVNLTLPPLQLRIEPARLGELCVAIGSPLGLRESASVGIVSGLSRQSKHPDGFLMEEMLQTDASINPGNSGGPLLDARGCLLGVNTLGSGETVNFAVPTEIVAVIVPELIRHGAIRRATLGVTVSAQWTPINGEQQSMVQIRTVKHEDSPLRAGDVLLQIGSTPIRRRMDIKHALNRDCIDRPVRICVLREGASVNLDVIAKEKG